MRLIRDAVPSSVDVPSSGRLMTGRLVFSSPGFRSVHTRHVHDWMSNDIARVDMLSLLRFTRSVLVSVPSSIEIPSIGTPQTCCLPPEGESRGAVH